jgi:hypothetical protein
MTYQFHDDDALLTRDMAAAALTAMGYPVRAKTLATKATRGGGPPYRLFGTRPLYRWGDALNWAQGRLSAPRLNTSANDALRSMTPQVRAPEQFNPDLHAKE